MFVLGGLQTDFARHFVRVEAGLDRVIGEIVDATLDAAKDRRRGRRGSAATVAAFVVES